MQTIGAVNRQTDRNRLGRLKGRGNPVVDAADRFLARRQAAELDRACSGYVPVWTPVRTANNPEPGPARPGRPSDRVVRTLKPRIALDRKRAFILAKDETVLDENGVRCVPFTVLPAPRDPEDDRRYLTPYILRGWDCVLFRDPDDPSLPCPLQMHDDPYETFQAALYGLPAEDRAAYLRRDGYKLFHHVPDPLR